MTTETMTEARRVAAERMAEAAGEWLAALGDEQRAKGQRPFEDGERVRWFYTPTVQSGLPLLEMDPQQTLLAHRLVSTGLSTGGYVTASTIMGLENTLHAKERWRRGPFFGYEGVSRGRDPLQYYLCVYGEPGGGTWGWHFGGHHVSLNVTILDGRVVSPTPTFFGADPADSQGVGPNSLRPLAGEEDLGRQLLMALDGGQRAKAVISNVAPLDMVQANRSRVEVGARPRGLGQIWSADLDPELRARMEAAEAQRIAEIGLTEQHLAALEHTVEPKGVAAMALNGGQRDMLVALLRQYVDRLPEDIAPLEWEALEGRGIDRIHFAWAGGAARKEPHYYRLQGPRLLIEYDNVQNGANHIHSVWRDPESDFGYDVLAAHRQAAHS